MLLKSLAVFSMTCSALCTGQEMSSDTLKTSKGPTDYIVPYQDDIKLRLGISNSFNSFRIRDEADNLDFTVSPNQRLRSTLTLMYRFIEVDLGYTPNFIRFNKDDATKGNTSFYAMGTRFYLGRWMQQLQYAKTKGFYVDKDDIGISENLLFPDFQVRKLGGNTAYIFNPDFSFRAIFIQSEWQKKSAGSFVPNISYYFTKITNDNSGTDHIIDINSGPAYYYNWVWHKSILLSAGAYGGFGYNAIKTTYDDDTPEEKVAGLSLQTQLRFTLGYNAAHFYSGATVSLNTFYYDTDPKIHIQDQQKFFEFYVGYRFKEPEKINEFFDHPPNPLQKKSKSYEKQL